jgi:hypothetical protein
MENKTKIRIMRTFLIRIEGYKQENLSTIGKG